MTSSPKTGDLARDELPETRDRLKFDQLDMMQIFTLRHPTLFLEAIRELKPEHFNVGGEQVRRLVWAKAVYLFGKYGTMPGPQVLETEVLAAMDADTDLFTHDNREEAVSLIGTAFEMEPGFIAGNTAWARDLLVNFLMERMVHAPLKGLMEKTGEAMVLANPLATLERLKTTYTRIAALGTSAASKLLPPGWKPQTTRYISTGIPWLDPIMGGGTNAGKVYGIFGPFGSFKTGFGVQVAVAGAQVRWEIAQATGEPPRLSVYVVYEGGEDEIRIRALATAAKMPKKHVVDHFLSDEPLSTFDSWKPYEVERRQQMQNPELMMPEVQRLEDGVLRTDNFRILDFSGSQANPHAGQGYIPEIVSALDRLRQDTGLEIGLVVIDYAKLMVRRYMRANGIKPEQTRFFMGDIPDTIRREVGERFGCAVWILQQLNTSANKKAAGSAQHHADSSEAGDFGENLWYCFTLSAVNKAQGHTIQLNATKTRDTEGLSEPLVVQISGNENCLVDAGARFTTRNGKIVRRDIAEAINPTVGERGRPGAVVVEHATTAETLAADLAALAADPTTAAADPPPPPPPPSRTRRPGGIGYTMPAALPAPSTPPGDVT